MTRAGLIKTADTNTEISCFQACVPLCTQVQAASCMHEHAALHGWRHVLPKSCVGRDRSSELHIAAQAVLLACAVTTELQAIAWVHHTRYGLQRAL